MYRDYTNYEIYEDGRVWSKKHKKFLKPYTRPDGYQQVNLFDNDGKRHMTRLHKAVYCAVNGLWNIPEGCELNHLDEDKTNNHISNLQLCTHKENVNFGTRTERASKSRTNHPEMSKRVGAYKNDELVMVFESINEARRQGYSQGNICSCCNCKFNREGNNVYKGYEWRYLDN